MDPIDGATRDGEFRRVPGKTISADAFAEHVDRDSIYWHTEQTGREVVLGRHTFMHHVHAHRDSEDPDAWRLVGDDEDGVIATKGRCTE